MDILRQTALALLLAALLPFSAAQADRLLIEKVERNRDARVPGNGITMEQVESRFGAPEARHSPVGDPPITRWVYPDFTVYFEHQLVINSVVHLASETRGS